MPVLGVVAVAAVVGAAASSPAAAGDPARGAAIVASRAIGLCVLCHPVPGVAAVQAGNLAPDLAGVGARFSAAQLRERLIDPARFNPQTVMPSATRTEGLARVAGVRRGRPLLDAQQLEDVIAYLETLR
ncbi:Sulfur oxidation protein SoxX [Rubrivivax sp. A210]|uniref:sulfur oxidation c-type cytochrome SoxX n=1 Tax=Rubrivivax sp. A210 TaxID=2772301 RepID=UPI001919B3EC|nr:sulfur oxidation c-type cytochrome SoxX [Rubrivivax sp. A210]CAD5374518.1 Sulfur oxidation protein SoxX [Rubrivivax sp. A210]